jgi:hypothetical protein
MNENALKLLDACLEAFDIFNFSKDVTGDGVKETFCNQAVDYVCRRMDYNLLNGMVANQMVDFISRSTDWSPVTVAAAQGYANEGRLLIAGAAADPHGHVVIVRPGIEDWSPKWGMKVPKVSHVGKKSLIGKHLGHAFVDVPEIWMLRENV